MSVSSVLVAHSKKMKAVVIGLWIVLFLSCFILWVRSGLSIVDTPDVLANWLKQFGIYRAALLYIIIYTLRPLLFFPATILTLASGVLFGPWWGIVFTLIGENASANFAFLIARYIGRDIVKANERGFVKKWDERLRKRGIETTLFMRLLFLPFDLVNYGCGLTSVRQRDYAIGTFIGIIPGAVTFVLLGGAVSRHAAGMIMVLGLQMPQRVFLIGLSAIFFIIGLIIARLLKKFNTSAAQIAS